MSCNNTKSKPTELDSFELPEQTITCMEKIIAGEITHKSLHDRAHLALVLAISLERECDLCDAMADAAFVAAKLYAEVKSLRTQLAKEERMVVA